MPLAQTFSAPFMPIHPDEMHSGKASPHPAPTPLVSAAARLLPAPLEPETRRLRLRQWAPRDREPFAALNADPRVMAYFPALLSRAESDAVAERCQALIAARGWGLWAVESRETGEFVGCVGLHVPSAELPFSPCVEIAWRLAFPFWGKGFATEAAEAALRTGFDQLGLAEIVSFTAVGNSRSRALMTRIGMRASGTFEHPLLPPESPLRRHCLYRLTEEMHARS